MDMVGHQADQNDPGLIQVASLGHGIEQALAIGVALKNRLPFVATECHMANHPVECDASWTRLIPPLAESQAGIQSLYFILGIDPMDGHELRKQPGAQNRWRP
jgi:hypothetical protein